MSNSIVKPCIFCSDGIMKQEETRILRVGAPTRVLKRWRCESCQGIEGIDDDNFVPPEERE